MVLFGRSVDDNRSDAVTIDNVSAAGRSYYLLALVCRRIATITGLPHLTTGRGRIDGLLEAMAARGLAPEPGHIRTGEFREEVACSVAREMIELLDCPTALYAAIGVTAFGVMQALADLGLRCAINISVASTDTIPGIAGLRPLHPMEHRVSDMTNEALRPLVDRTTRGSNAPPARSCSSHR